MKASTLRLVSALMLVALVASCSKQVSNSGSEKERGPDPLSFCCSSAAGSKSGTAVEAGGADRLGRRACTLFGPTGHSPTYKQVGISGGKKACKRACKKENRMVCKEFAGDPEFRSSRLIQAVQACGEAYLPQRILLNR